MVPRSVARLTLSLSESQLSYARLFGARPSLYRASSRETIISQTAREQPPRSQDTIDHRAGTGATPPFPDRVAVVRFAPTKNR